MEKRKHFCDFIFPLKLFKNLNDEQKRKIIVAFKKEKYKKEDYIVRQGEQCDAIYFLVHGDVYANKESESGEIEDINYYKAGDYFEDLPLIKD